MTHQDQQMFSDLPKALSFESANIFIILWYSLDKIKSQGSCQVCTEGKKWTLYAPNDTELIMAKYQEVKTLKQQKKKMAF